MWKKRWFKTWLTPDYLKKHIVEYLSIFSERNRSNAVPTHIVSNYTHPSKLKVKKDLSPRVYFILPSILAYLYICLLFLHFVYFDSSQTHLQKAPHKKLQPLAFDILSLIALNDLWANLQALQLYKVFGPTI